MTAMPWHNMRINIIILCVCVSLNPKTNSQPDYDEEVKVKPFFRGTSKTDKNRKKYGMCLCCVYSVENVLYLMG